jgi:hypothetical protein
LDDALVTTEHPLDPFQVTGGSDDGWEDDYSFSKGWGASGVSASSPLIWREDTVTRADQIALWLKNLADIMHVEAAKV